MKNKVKTMNQGIGIGLLMFSMIWLVVAGYGIYLGSQNVDILMFILNSDPNQISLVFPDVIVFPILLMLIGFILFGVSLLFGICFIRNFGGGKKHEKSKK